MEQEIDGSGVVHIIDDDVAVCRALDSLFRSVRMDVRTYGSVPEFLALARQDELGCIVLDVRLPGMNGLDFHQHLAELGVFLPVILITGYGDIPMSVKAMKAGAVDFLSKPFRGQDMLDAVNAAIERDRLRRLEERDVASVRTRFATLSPREKQVMMLVTAGKMNKQVAAELGISEITVKIHRSAVMRKMAARTFAQLVRLADALKSVVA